MKDLNIGGSAFPLSSSPSLKSGVRVLEIPTQPASGGNIFVGTSLGGVLFSGTSLKGLLSHLDGSRSLADFLHSNIFSQREIESTLTDLLQANLLIFLHNKQESNARDFLPESERFSALRLAPESRIASWNPKMVRDARTTVSARSTFAILIFGTSRLATVLFSILLASGFSQIKIISGDRALMTATGRREDSSLTSVEEICGLNVALGDVGKARSETFSRIMQSSQLLPSPQQNFPAIPDLVISTETAQPDYIQRWMSEGVAHIQISHLNQSFIEIGPLVLPGSGPCLRCVEMQKFGAHEIQGLVELANTLEKAPELSSAAVAMVSGFVAANVIQFADTGRSPMVQKSVRFNLVDVSNPEHIYWQPHIFCGCLEVI